MRVLRRHAVHPIGRRSRRRRRALSIVGILTGITFLGAVATAILAVVVTRQILVPPLKRDEDTKIVSVDSNAGTITFSRSIDAVTDGRLSFWFDASQGHAQIGRIVADGADTVTRELSRVDFGDLATARRGRFNGWYYLYPSDLGVEYENVIIETELGPAPAWLLSPDPKTPHALEHKWVIHVHGRAVMRAETIRGVPVFREAGYTSLLISYRNDLEAPSSADGRYTLGDTEWRDVEAALAFAQGRGAASIVLVGWSMGGATVLQAASRSTLASLVVGLVLESPVIDWVDALDFQASAQGIRRPMRALVYAMIGSSWGKLFTGLHRPIDLRRLNFVRRAAELTVPTLILHSDDDAYIPSTASRALAEARSDIVSLETFTIARHTKLWNYDSERWNSAIAAWLSRLEPIYSQTDDSGRCFRPHLVLSSTEKSAHASHTERTDGLCEAE